MARSKRKANQSSAPTFSSGTRSDTARSVQSLTQIIKTFRRNHGSS